METAYRVLHVDDDDDIRLITRMTLELVGKFHVAQFASGRAAIDNALEFRPQIFLLDVMMPEITGVETWQHLKSIEGLADIPAIFMTAKAERSYVNQLMEQGAAAVITKPFDPAELCGKIREILE